MCAIHVQDGRKSVGGRGVGGDDSMYAIHVQDGRKSVGGRGVGRIAWQSVAEHCVHITRMAKVTLNSTMDGITTRRSHCYHLPFLLSPQATATNLSSLWQKYCRLSSITRLVVF